MFLQKKAEKEGYDCKEHIVMNSNLKHNWKEVINQLKYSLLLQVNATLPKSNTSTPKIKFMFLKIRIF